MIEETDCPFFEEMGFLEKMIKDTVVVEGLQPEAIFVSSNTWANATFTGFYTTTSASVSPFINRLSEEPQTPA
jgi:hypothetical protein